MVKFTPWIPRYKTIDTPAESYLRFGGHKKTKFGSRYATCQFYTHIIVYLGWIRGIHYSNLPIHWIETTYHSSSEVSRVDLYNISALV